MLINAEMIGANLKSQKSKMNKLTHFLGGENDNFEPYL